MQNRQIQLKLSNKKYKIKFEPVVVDARPNNIQCITINGENLYIKGSITYNDISASKTFTYQGCYSYSNINNPSTLFKLDTFGVSLKMFQAYPSGYENTLPVKEEYSAKFILKNL